LWKDHKARSEPPPQFGASAPGARTGAHLTSKVGAATWPRSRRAAPSPNHRRDEWTSDCS
jgi:hypothetical protein